MRMGEQATQKISTIGTGALGLDLATDAAAIQEDASSKFIARTRGKPLDTPCNCTMPSRSETAAFIDAEHALDPTYAETLGVNIDALLVSHR